MSKYEEALYYAHRCRIDGKFAEAVAWLDKAERLTRDEEELYYLKNWREAIRKQAEANDRPGKA